MFLLTRCSLFADRPPPPPSGNRLTGTVEDRGGTAPLPASGPAGPCSPPDPAQSALARPSSVPSAVGEFRLASTVALKGAAVHRPVTVTWPRRALRSARTPP